MEEIFTVSITEHKDGKEIVKIKSYTFMSRLRKEIGLSKEYVSKSKLPIEMDHKGKTLRIYKQELDLRA